MNGDPFQSNSLSVESYENDLRRKSKELIDSVILKSKFEINNRTNGYEYVNNGDFEFSNNNNK